MLGCILVYIYRAFHNVLRDTNIYNKKTEGPALMEFFTATEKIKKYFFGQLEMFDVCTTGDTAHIDMIFKLLPHASIC
jgi:hypothetical protein